MNDREFRELWSCILWGVTKKQTKKMNEKFPMDFNDKIRLCAIFLIIKYKYIYIVIHSLLNAESFSVPCLPPPPKYFSPISLWLEMKYILQ